MRWSGKIGFRLEAVETIPGVFEHEEKTYTAKGWLIENRSRNQNRDDTENDSITFDNYIEIAASPYSLQNMHNILYVTYLNQKWRVSSARVNGRRIRLTLGGVYNDQP